MPEPYDYEIRDTAKDLFVTDGRTYEQVAAATGVSVTQLKRWGSDEGWTEARREYRAALGEIRQNTVKLRATLLQTALSSGGDPQSVYAFAALEKIFASQRHKADAEGPARPVAVTTRVATPQDAVTALEQVVEQKINRLLTQPEGLNLSQVKDVKQTLELIDQMKAKYADTEASAADKGLDAESIRNIREMLNL